MKMKKTKILIVLVLLALFYGNNDFVLRATSSQNYNPIIKPYINCLTNDDCELDKVCHNNLCEPCRLEGEFSPNSALCCENRLDADGRCVLCDISNGCFPAFSGEAASSGTVERLLGYILGLVGSIFLFVMIISAALYAVLSGNKKKIFFLKRIFTIATMGFVISLLAIFCLMLSNCFGF